MADALRVEGLSVSYPRAGTRALAVDDLSFQLQRGEVLGLVGESGAGKSTTALALLGLIKPPRRVEAGRAVLDGTDLLGLDPARLRRRRWASISLVPQNALSALNPVMRVGAQIADAIDAHERGRPAPERIGALLDSVGLPTRAARQYPHELSAGMRQRVCIAMAIALEPAVIVADEATSALDTVTQRAVAETLKAVQERLGTAVLLIGHDIALQAQLADRIAVMRAGRLVEIGPAGNVLRSAAHPYTRLLVNAVPHLNDPAWRPSAAIATRRDDVPRLVGERHPLTEVGPDHLAAVP
jgi:peptide/nickel transport system ATP-binding protein